MNKPCLISTFALFLFVLSTTIEARAGSLVPDSDCPGLVCTLAEPSLAVPINVSWQPDTSNLGFVDVFLEWRVFETDPDWAIAGATVSSNPFNGASLDVAATGFSSSAPDTASFTISYSSQLRPQTDPQGLDCGTSGLCTDFFGAVTYTVEVEAFEAQIVTLGTQNVGDGVSLSITENTKQHGGSGNVVGGQVHSPAGAPDLFFRAASTPTFPGALWTFVEWSLFTTESPPGVWAAGPWEGAVDGSDNWMKVIRDSDGAVSWAQFEFDFSMGNATDPVALGIPLYVSFPDGRDFPVSLAAAAASNPQVTFGTHQVAEGVSLSVSSDSKQGGGSGELFGGQVHSPSGAPDLFFRAASTPTFPGALEPSVEWSIRGDESSPGVFTPFPWEGAVDGSDNWMKVIRDGDGAVSWAQFVFDFSAGNATDPTLLDVLLYVSIPDGSDFPLEKAVEAVPEPGFGLLLAVGSLGLAGSVRRRRSSR